MQNIGVPKSASEMESQVFQKSSSQEEYRNTVAKLVVHMQSKYMDITYTRLKHFTIDTHGKWFFCSHFQIKKIKSNPKPWIQ